MSDCDVLRRIAERGMLLAHERDSAFVDLFQHLLDEIPRVQKQMDKTQAYSEQLRQLPDHVTSYTGENAWSYSLTDDVINAIYQPSNTSTLESFVEKAGEKMRERCVDKAFLKGIDIAEVAQSIPKNNFGGFEMSEVLGYVWMESSVLIPSIDKAIQNIISKLGKEKQIASVIANRKYRKRWFRKDRTDEECFAKFLGDYNNQDSWEYRFVVSGVNILVKDLNKLRDSAEKVTKVLVSLETVSKIKKWC